MVALDYEDDAALLHNEEAVAALDGDKAALDDGGDEWAESLCHIHLFYKKEVLVVLVFVSGF